MGNEDIRYLATIESGFEFNKGMCMYYLKNWNKSVNETERLLRYIITRNPHPVREMLAIAECRQMILNLDRPLSEFINAISKNVTAVETAEQSNAQMGVPLVDAEKIPLDGTHEVCTSANCMTYIKEGKKMKIRYTCK